MKPYFAFLLPLFFFMFTSPGETAQTSQKQVSSGGGAAAPYYEFDMKTAVERDVLQLKDPEKRIQELCSREEVKNNADAIFDLLTEQEKKEIIVFYVITAATAYISDKNTKAYFILSPEQWRTVYTDYKVQFYKSNDLKSNDLGVDVPAKFGTYDDDKVEKKNYVLQLSPGFFTRFDHKKRIYKIAHEVIGHGIPFRYFSKVLSEKINPKGIFKKTIDKTEEEKALFREGIATCVESVVYNAISGKPAKTSIQFAEDTYQTEPFIPDKENENPAYRYVYGVRQLIGSGISPSSYGDIQWNVLNAENQKLGGKAITPYRIISPATR